MGRNKVSIQFGKRKGSFRDKENKRGGGKRKQIIFKVAIIRWNTTYKLCLAIKKVCKIMSIISWSLTIPFFVDLKITFKSIAQTMIEILAIHLRYTSISSFLLVTRELIPYQSQSILIFSVCLL